MITLISLATLQAPNYEKVSFKGVQDKAIFQNVTNNAQVQQKVPLDTLKAYTIPFAGKTAFEQKIMPAGSMMPDAFDKAIEKHTGTMTSVIEDFSQRASRDKQFLNWVSLPAAQLEKDGSGKSHLDEVYTQALELKSHGNKAGTDNPRTLVVLGIGGSKHTGEFLLNMSGAGRDESKGKVLFYADIDNISYKDFLTEAGGKIEDLNFLVVSKSGTTFETKDGYVRFKNALKEHYTSKGMDEKAAESAAQKHFGFVTDKTGTEKNLRGEIGDKNGRGNEGVKELYVHDDVGGRYSMFDDAGIFELAYAGVDKVFTERILKAADKANEKALAKDIAANPAAKAAIFNLFSREEGAPVIQQQLFGRAFEGGGENFLKQIYLESLKDVGTYGVGCAPASMHYASEGHFNPENRGKYSTILTKMDDGAGTNYKNYTAAIEYAYNNNDVDRDGVFKGANTAVMVEQLATESGKIKPEAIGEYIQSKNFETVYMGMLRRAVENKNITPQGEAVPEVLQPSVEVYKNNFKPGSPFELKPGQ